MRTAKLVVPARRYHTIGLKFRGLIRVLSGFLMGVRRAYEASDSKMRI